MVGRLSECVLLLRVAWIKGNWCIKGHGMGGEILQHSISLLSLVAIHGYIVVDLLVAPNRVRRQVAIQFFLSDDVGTQ
jgi:hypothetical protein